VPRLKEIIDILKKSKHSSPKPVFCPACYSAKLKHNESYGILPRLYRCENCGYEGPLVLELEPNSETDHRV
jgi:predicted RNA-binding Zn-ribbon protein involved in translation (DUF1610 family)